MSDLQVRIENLSPAKRKLLELQYAQQAAQLFPLSYAQQRLWFLDQLEPGSALYNINAAFRLSGCLMTEVLQRSLDEIIRRHDVLRTTFTFQDGVPVQRIAPVLKIRLEEIDLSQMPEAKREAEAERLTIEEADKPFDLTCGPLMRVKLLQLSVQEHVLLVSMHHIVSDAWSMGIMVREFSQLYAAFARGQESPLAELPIQYADFAVWQREWLQGEVLEEQLGYWRKQLAGVPVLEMPTDYGRPRVRSHRGGSVGFKLGRELTQQLQELARAENATLFMGLLAGFQVVLGRYAGQQDVAIGTAIANRNRVEVEGLIGFFVNTLVLRTDMRGNPSFRELLGRVRQVVLEAQENQDVPFEKLVEELAPQHDLSRPPLFQVLLALQNTGPAEMQLPGLKVTPIDSVAAKAKFDLFLMLSEGVQGVAGPFFYSLDLYEPSTAERFLTHLTTALKNMVAEPGFGIEDVSLLAEAERQQAVVGWNQTSREYPQQGLTDLFEQQAHRAPSAVAVEYDGQRYTYEELNRAANQLAHHLKELGVGEEELVGICLQRSFDAIVALLAALKTGAAYLLLDPSYPAERLQFMLKDAGIRVLICREDLLPDVKGHGELLCVDVKHLRSVTAEKSEENLGTVIEPINLAYAMYTSGSSGRPKGALIPHRAITRLVLNTDYVRVNPGDRVAHVSNMSFDAATFEIWGALLNGASLIIVTPEIATSARDLGMELQDRKVNIVMMATALFHEVARENGRAFKNFDYVMFGGEAADPQWSRKVLQDGPPGFLRNVYGPTEATTLSSWYGINSVSDDVRTIPIGQAAANTQLYIANEQMSLTPIGVAGELYIGGDGLGRGYLNEPRLTAQKFLPDPFSGVPGARLYRTGDLVRRRKDGNIEFVGRLDFQVKIRGFRIELEEIETALLELNNVEQAAVLVQGQESASKKLVAYVAGRDLAAAMTSRELREYMRERLPDYMVPSAFMLLETLPLSPNGKIDRRTLASLEIEREERGYLGPRNQTEEILCGLWEELLQLHPIGIEDNFFEMGGHSLLATRLMARIRSCFSIELPLRRLFEAPTVAAMAQIVSASKAEEVPPIVKVTREQAIPLSFAQQRLWFLDQLEPGSVAYNMVFGLRLKGELNQEALGRSFMELLGRHEVLRTIFMVKDTTPVQIIAAEQKFEIEKMDLGGLSEVEREREISRHAQAEAVRPFDLGRGPLMRVKLLQLSVQEHVLLVSMHHIVSDAWSMGIMVREFSQLYAAFARGQESPLAELPIQYADFAVWQREWLQGEVLEEQLGYWRKQLAGVPVLEMPTDYGRPRVRSHRGGSVGFKLGRELTQQLQELARAENATLFMGLLAGFQVVLGRYAGQQDVAIGTAIANRNRVEVEGLIGFFVNTLVLRTDMRGNPSFRELLGRVRQVVLEAQENQDVPFEKLVEELGPSHELSQSQFQVGLALQNTEQSELSLLGLSVTRFDPEATTAKFDLLLALSEGAEGVAGQLSYALDLYQASTVERLLGHLKAALQQMVAKPESGIEEIPLLTEAEWQHVVMDWNNTGTEIPQKYAHELFEEQVERTPDAVALEFEGQSLNYRELNRRANQLAHYLRKQEVGPEVLVGLCVDRSLEMVVGLLGILKAGGAYLPLDPMYPPERLKFMMDDARVTVVLTQSKLKQMVPHDQGIVLCLDGDWEQVGVEPDHNLTRLLVDENAAYVIYTSGSTGQPKGVVICQRSVTNIALAAMAALKIGAGSRLLQFVSISFDMSVVDFMSALLTGATVVLKSAGMRLVGPALEEALHQERITVAILPPSVLQTVGDSEFPLLEVLGVGGEACPGELVRRWGSNRLMINGWGPTETTVCATFAGPLKGDRAPIGKPLANTQVYALDERMNPVPAGLAGELYIGGIGLARGYLNRPDLTAERFVPDPFSHSGERLYRTGDLGRLTADGDLDFVARSDEQVKVRGHRIEPGEIESALLQHSGVREAVVIAREDIPGDKRLVAYLTARGTNSRLNAGELRQLLRVSLPDYMIPAAFVVLEALPLTPNGKVDRKALPVPDYLGDSQDYVAPRDAEEEILCAIFADLLKVERLGIHDNFFERGGHSLLATKAMSRVRSAFGVELPLRVLFEAPRVSELLEQIKAARGTPTIGPLTRTDRGGDLPLSYSQQRLWLISRLNPESVAYNIPIGLRLSGDLDRAAMQASLDMIIRRHEVLRTTFPAREGKPVQEISPDLSVRVEFVDLRKWKENERETEARRLARIQAETPFDLGFGPLLRVKLLQLADQEHVLLVTMHHIVSDAWSMGITVREFRQLYEAHCQGKQDAGLPDLAIQYADFAAWQRQWLQGEVLEEQLGYWRTQLADAPVLDLPTDHARPRVMSHRGAGVSIHLPAELSEKLRGLARQQGVTLFMALLAGLQTMLSKYAGQEDISTGTSFANRNREEIEGLIGFFVNTLVLRTDLKGDPDFIEVLKRVRHVALEAYRHQDAPFEKLVEELTSRRDTGRSPFFQVILVLQSMEQENLQLPGLRLSSFGSQHEVAKFDLSFMLSERGEAITGTLSYALDLFEKETVERLLGRFQLVLEQMVSGPEQRIAEVSLVREAERRQMLIDWNQTEVDYPQGCVHKLFEEQARKTPESLAVIFDGQALSYAELNRRANQLGHYLRNVGVGPEVRVGICMERSLETVVALLGILKAGGAYIPLDPKLPVERMAFMLEDSQVAVLLTKQSIMDRLSATWMQVVQLDADQEQFVHESEENVAVEVVPENLLYLIYTSGSTGKPKAVGIEHRQMVNYQQAVWERAQFKPGSSFAFISSLAADLGNTMVFPALCGGGTLHVIPEDMALNEKLLRDYVRRYEIDYIKITPTHLRALLNGENGHELLPSGRLVLGGEASPWDWAASLRDLKPQLQVMNHYGPTECTVGATTYELNGGRKPSSGTLPLGRPLSNAHVYVLNAEMNPVPIGVAGELYIGGAGVGRGYLNRAELTAERFLPDAFSRKEGARLYRTGDRVKWLPGGNLEFLGRLDEQVKIRGFRIELGEIESALLDHGGIAEAAVVARTDERGENRLVAYVVPSVEIATGELRDALKRRLPEYMVPSAFVTLDALPLMPNGKIDRRKLPEPAEAGMAQIPESGLRTPIEEILVGIWSQVLQVDKVGVHDNFFALGGHSLLATQVIARVRSVLSVEMPLGAIFEAPTVAGLAERIEQQQRNSKLEIMPMRRVDRSHALPLSFAQQRLWFIDQMQPGSAAYNIAFGMRLHGQVEKEVLKKSLNEMVRRHEVLRTHFDVHDGQPVQKIALVLELDVAEVELRELAEHEYEAEAEKLARAEAAGAFDLSHGPLVRMKLLRLREEEYVLLVTMHHIVSDGWSTGIIVREFSQLYPAYLRDEESPLPELKIQYGDFAMWQRTWLQGEVLESQLQYWREQLGELEPLELPADHARPPVMSQSGASVSFSMTSELSGKLKDLSRREGVTLFMSLLAGFQVVLSKYAGQHDVAVGVPIANRRRVEVEDVIGFFVNTLVLRTDLSGNPTIIEVLQRVRQVTLDAYQHQDVPFEKLVEELQPKRDLSRSPLFQVMLALQNTQVPELQLPGLQLSGYLLESKVSKFDLSLGLRENANGIAGGLNYASDLYEAATVERLLRHLAEILEQVVEEPERRIGDLSLLSGEEREQVLVGWNRTEAKYPQRYVHELFEEQAVRRPGAVAVEYEGQELTYKELNRRANQLGHYLRNMGVGPEVRVGICMERSLEMVVGLLGVLKAGGAYVPLEPGYPAERLAYMLEDARVAVVIAQKKWVGVLPQYSGQVIPIDSGWAQKELEPGENPGVQLEPGNLAYVIYTSGSTGSPKGAMNAHGALSNRLQWMQEAYGLGEDERVLQKTPFSFDVSVWEFFWPLMLGARLVVARPGGHQDVEYLRRLIHDRQISTLHFVPSMLAAFLECGEDKREENCRSLRRVICSGEALGKELAQRCLDRLGAELHNLYGPTEAAIDVTCWKCEREVVEKGVAIGRPIANTQVYVLDEVMEPVGLGLAGELYLGGRGLGRGYVGRPELTAERWVPNAFSVSGGERLYRTGDRVRWRNDGNLEFLGRNDQQVKLRGFRIELGEIEAALLGHAGIQQAVVVVLGKEGDKSLAAYVTARQNTQEPLSIGQLREYLRGKLPEYMVPAIMVLPELPLTRSGKIDRRALPEFQHQDHEGQQQIIARTAEEEILSGIFAAVLKREKVGVSDNFFDLGGHSLLATQVMSRIAHVLGVELPLRKIFESPTAAGLAQTIRLQRQTGKNLEVQSIRRADRNQPLPLSFAQMRLWFIDQLEPNSPAYNISFGLRLSGTLDRVAVRKSLNEIVRRHEVLHTAFPMSEGGVTIQKIDGRMEPEFREIDLTALPATELEAEIKKLARVEASRPFNLAHGPLLRLNLLQAGEQEHVLLVIMHHIISDGWSLGILVREFSQLYAAFVAGEGSPLAELPIQYADFALWQQQWLRGEVLFHHLDYWKQQLAGLSLLELPTDRPRPLIESHRGEIVPFEFGRAASMELRKLAQREGVTLFMTLLAAFQVVLRRYTWQSDIAVGTDVANRNRMETEGLIGFFVNQLVLRADLSDDMDFSTLLAQARRTTLEAHEHQDVPFEKVVEELEPGRDLTRSPLFQVSLTMQNTPGESLHLPGVKVRLFDLGNAPAKLDIEVVVIEDREGKLLGNVRYAADLFDWSTINRLAGHLRCVLESVVVNAKQSIHEINLLTAQEQAQMVEDWNWAEGECPQQCAHELFEEQVAQTPGAIAAEYAGQKLTYRELNHRANQIAHYLRRVGVTPETYVGVYLERSLDLMAALLGVLKAGGVYLPLDPAYPADRLAHMIQDASPLVLVRTRALANQLDDAFDSVISLDQHWELIVRETTENPASRSFPESLAYVMYTSGSTGKPKGAMIEHRGMMNHLAAKVMDLALTRDDVIAQNAPSSFDISIWQFLAPLLVGARIQIIENQTAADPWNLLKEVQSSRVTVLETVPTLLGAMLSEQQRAGDARLDLRHLRCLISNAEALPSSMCAEWQTTHPHIALMNTYGATECSDDTCHCYIRGSQDAFSYAPLGSPIMNTTIYVLDQYHQPVPMGVAGELCIGGLCLGRGYLNQPGLTAQRFVPDPFARTGGERLYRTGDRGRWRPDGSLEFLGRTDKQIKIRGHRIELGEIEMALNEHAEVEQSVVMVRQDRSGDKYLAGYVVPLNKGERLDIAALRRHLQNLLPDYMVPQSLTELQALPLTPSGKLDRKALPEPEQTRNDDNFVGPRNGEEEILCGIFAEVLNLERVGIQDDFFELGGHSLLATQVISRVRKVFGVELPLRDLFEAPVVSRLAERVQAYLGSDRNSIPPLAPVNRASDLPLSYAQQRLWFIDQLEPGSSAYSIPLAVRLRGHLNKEALLRSLNEIVRRHEVLRTNFPMRNGRPVQNIAPEMKLNVQEVDLSRFSGDAQEHEARRYIRTEANEPFDLALGPLMRGKLLRLGEEEHVVLVTMHHIVGDGWSNGVLLAELTRLYEAFANGQESPLEDLRIQYADFAVWQREWLQGEVLQEQLEYWKKQLEGAAVLVLPADRRRPAVPSRHAERLILEIEDALKSALTAISRRAGTTLYMTLLAAFQTLLARYSGQDDVVVGIPIAGRSYAETESLIGMFFNVLAIRMNLAGDPGFRELLGRVRETMLGAYAHQDLPFERLVAALDLERNTSYNPLFQVIFEMNNTPRGREARLSGLWIEAVQNEHEVAKVDLTFTMADSGSGMRGALQYSKDLFDRQTIERMAVHYQRLLEGIAANPEQRLSELPLLSAEEREQVLVQWNGTAVDYGQAACLHELFEQQVEETPAAVAVVQGRIEVSYREMEERANRLGNYLRRLGVGPEVRVGICVGRSVEMVVGLLGILKAGGAYVPLDPTYPAERIRYMVEDAQAGVVITEEKLLQKLPEGGIRVVCLDQQREEIAGESARRARSGVQAESMAYIYYTSGSTGRPKGVVMAHSGIVNYMRWGVEAYEARGGHGAAVHSSIAVDLTLTNFLPLFVGEKMVLAEEMPGVEGLVELLQGKPEWSLLKVTPTHLTLLNTRLTAEEMRHSTRVLVIGADNLVAEPTLVWREQAPGVKLLNEYGPTETVVGCSLYRIEAGAPRSGGMPIGKPIANMRMYVLDKEGQPVPVGVVGELYIGGIGVARGYWGRPELTAERFLPEPYGGEAGGRYYRTGDRARFLADGDVEFLGRVDHQVKIRGYRIEPAEVEAVLSGCAGIQKAMVVVREDVPGEKRLVGYVAVGDKGRSGVPGVGELREYLKERLPEYMVPSAWVIMEELPVRGSGKIDPKDLPRPEMGGEAKTYVEPRTEVEKLLAEIWREGLGLKQVGVHDNFFELGGDSISSIQIIRRAREAGLQVQPRQMFERQTIAELAEVVRSEAEQVETTEKVAGEAEETQFSLARMSPAELDELASLLDE